MPLVGKPLPDVRLRCRPVSTAVPATLVVPLIGPERTAGKRREHSAPGAQNAVRYNPGVEMLQGEAQQHNFGRWKSAAEIRVGPPFPVARNLNIRNEFHGEQFSEAHRLGEITISRTSSEHSKLRTCEVAWTQWWRRSGCRVEELPGASRVGDMPRIRNREDGIYLH